MKHDVQSLSEFSVCMLKADVNAEQPGCDFSIFLIRLNKAKTVTKSKCSFHHKFAALYPKKEKQRGKTIFSECQPWLLHNNTGKLKLMSTFRTSFQSVLCDLEALISEVDATS